MVNSIGDRSRMFREVIEHVVNISSLISEYNFEFIQRKIILNCEFYCADDRLFVNTNKRNLITLLIQKLLQL